MSESRVGECSCCGFEGIEVKEYRSSRNPFDDEPKWDLCEVCAGSFISSAARYGYENAMLYRSLGYCTNLILRAIAEPTND